MNKRIESQTTKILFQHPTRAEQSNFIPKLKHIGFKLGEFFIVGTAASLVAAGITLVSAMGGN